MNDSQLESELRAIFSADGFDLDKETTKSIRSKLCKSLGLEKFPPSKKGKLKDLIKRLVNEDDARGDGGESAEEDIDEGEDGELDSDKETPSPRGRKRPREPQRGGKQQKASPAKGGASDTTSHYNSKVKSLLDLGNAMRMGPRLYRGLKEMKSDTERVDALTERLQDAGASWKGKLPSKQDIQAARQERQRLDDLDGIDTSLILDGTNSRRGRRGRTAAVSYVEKDENDDEQEEEEEEKTKPSKKQKKKQSDASSDDDNDDEDDDYDGESSEEEEFE